MNFESTLSSLIFLILFGSVGCTQESISLSEDFIDTIPPIVGSSEWYMSNYSIDEFGVKITKGELIIDEADESKECELVIPNGKLLGVNRGEWGGTLTFVPQDTTKSSIKIKDGNVKFVFTFKDKIYFIEGIAHMGFSEGGIFELDIEGEKFSYRKIVDFEDSPEAFAIYEDQFFIVTHKSFYVVKNFRKKRIFKDAFWFGLYPNSIAVIDQENVFVGIRGGIVKLNIKTKSINYYKKKE